jgi:drug/metabolite transporter superfamily protein YnfA
MLLQKEEPDIEMSRKTFVKIDMERLSAHASVVNASILDNVVKKFSIVSSHHVEGRWRPALAFAVIGVPIVMFCVMLWYQVQKACIANCQYYPLVSVNVPNGVAYSTESTIRNFLAQDSIHFCSAMVEQAFVDETGNVTTDWAPCTIKNHDYSNTGPCAPYKDLNMLVSEFDLDNGNCYNGVEVGGNVAVFYTQCVPIQTALVNSIQVAMYSIVATIVLYLALRVLSAHGVLGLFLPSKWMETINNTTDDAWKRTDAAVSEKE